MANDDAYEKYYADQEDTIDWSREAAGVIRDIVQHVKQATVSERLAVTDSEAFINVLTLEGREACVKLNGEGLQIVGHRFDGCELDSADNMRYETPYSLLSVLSPAYVQSFGNCLADALSKQLQDRLVGNGCAEAASLVDGNEEDVEGPD